MVDATSDARTSRPLRLGMVGGGRGAFIGAVHRLCARMDGQFELVAGALSSDAQRARDSGADLGLAPDRAYTSFVQMAAAEAKRSDGIEVVSIVTPNDSHHAIARAFLDRGIDVICDKPMTTTVEDALDLVQAVRRSGLVFGLTHNYTGYPLVRQAREMVAGGGLGTVRGVHAGGVPERERLAAARVRRQGRPGVEPGAPQPAAALAGGRAAANPVARRAPPRCGGGARDPHSGRPPRGLS